MCSASSARYFEPVTEITMSHARLWAGSEDRPPWRPPRNRSACPYPRAPCARAPRRRASPRRRHARAQVSRLSPLPTLACHSALPSAGSCSSQISDNERREWPLGAQPPLGAFCAKNTALAQVALPRRPVAFALTLRAHRSVFRIRLLRQGAGSTRTSPFASRKTHQRPKSDPHSVPFHSTARRCHSLPPLPHDRGS